MKKFGSAFIPGICWLIISTILLTLPGAAFPKEDWLDKIWFDKWVHISLFFIMVVLWCFPVSGRLITKEKKKKLFVAIAIGWLVYGIAMEFVQEKLISKRSFDEGDIIADGVGCLAGLLFCLGRYIKK